MAYIARYQKVVDNYTTYTLRLPEDSQGNALAQEFCLLEKYTYVAVMDGVELPDQPEQIAVELVTLTDELRAQLKAASQHVRLINHRVVEKIREQYSVDDELKMARIVIGKLSGRYTPTEKDNIDVGKYMALAQGARAWGAAEKAKLGLS